MSKRKRNKNNPYKSTKNWSRRNKKAMKNKKQELILESSNLENIPKSVSEYPNLKKLTVSGNRLTTIPNFITKLSKLQIFYAWENKFKKFPVSLLNLPYLRELDLADNQITNIPEDISNLTKLERLLIQNNKLGSIPDSLGTLSNLWELDLSNNNLQSLPESLKNLTSLKKLYLHNNQDLNIPKSILGPNWKAVRSGHSPANPQDIIDYYFRIQKDVKPLNEAKVILVGFGAVGKTSVVRRLIENDFNRNEKKTDGIKIDKWEIDLNENQARAESSLDQRILKSLKSKIIDSASKDHKDNITLHVWDFGGQEINHNTHQFFLTDRSLYLLVLNGRQGHEDTDAEYWLEFIRSFGHNSPVIILLNKIKEQPFDLNRNALRQKFPNICAFICTDCKDATGFQDLSATIRNQIYDLEHLRDAFPSSWFNIKNRLADMAENYVVI